MVYYNPQLNNQGFFIAQTNFLYQEPLLFALSWTVQISTPALWVKKIWPTRLLLNVTLAAFSEPPMYGS